MTTNWLILQIWKGNCFDVERELLRVGVPNYLPRYMKDFPFDRKRERVLMRPLLHGYLFPATTFDVQAINTLSTRVRLLAHQGRYLTVSESEMARVREAEVQAQNQKNWHPLMRDVIEALWQATNGIVPKTFVNLGDLQRAVA